MLTFANYHLKLWVFSFKGRKSLRNVMRNIPHQMLRVINGAFGEFIGFVFYFWR